MQPPLEKASLRRGVAGQRRALAPEEWCAEDEQRTHWLLRALGAAPRTVALYASRPGEPGTTEAITALHDAGWSVLLPTVTGPPGWAFFPGWDRMRKGWGGIPEPLEPVVAPLHLADVVVVACLAVARDGTRLGTGGGWYDRTLPLRRPGVPVWALARTRELCGELPSEGHDIAVDAALTPDGMFVCGDAWRRSIGNHRPPELS